MTDGAMLSIAAFTVASSLVGLVALLRPSRATAVETRLQGLNDDGGFGPTFDTETSMDVTSSRTAAMLMPRDEKRKKQLRDRLIHAGLYKRNSTLFYVLTKTVLLAFPILLGLIASSAGVITMQQAIFFGLFAGGLGTILPGLWLDHQKTKRQTEIRRALPDALDVIVVCVEGGLSLPAAIERVSRELRTAHRTLAAEMGIVKREIQLGYSTGEALKRFADRFDVEELRSLAAVILQAERFGASIVNALRVHADSLRLKRKQMAEEQAQKASVKLVFPTVLFIFPALFVVIMGPAVFDIMEMFAQMAQSR